jgi:type IV pilus assembly protein PilE
MNARARGFSLVELLVTLGIIALLASIAYPSYLQYTQRGNRTDATRNMMLLGQALERCYSQTFSYIGCANVAAATTTTFYTISLATPSASEFTLTAVPNGPPQSNDTTCQKFTMSSGGVQTATDAGGADQTTKCWGSS